MMTKLRHTYDNLTTMLIYKKKSYDDLKINLMTKFTIILKITTLLTYDQNSKQKCVLAGKE